MKMTLRYEIQTYLRVDTVINFGETEMTLEETVNYFSKEHNGFDIRIGAEEYSQNAKRSLTSNESFFISFHTKKDAQKFFNELYEKLSPRMFGKLSHDFMKFRE